MAVDLAHAVSAAAARVARAGARRIASACIHGASCEGWLKVELLHELSVCCDRLAVERGNVDLVANRGGENVLIELKTFCTNYGRSGKPITQFINGVVGDLGKLSQKRGDGVGVVIWLAYDVPLPEPGPWAGHVARVASAARRVIQTTEIPLRFRAGARAMLYAMESR